MSQILIAGLGTSSFAAILAARKIDRACEITVIDEKDYDLMHPCGLPYAVEGVIDTFDKLKHSLRLDRMKIDHRSRHRITEIDTRKQFVKALNLDTREVFSLPFDKLLIATGSRPFIPPVPGLQEFAGRGVFTISTPDDACKLAGAATAGSDAVVLGAGAIGLETAAALARKKLNVRVVEMLDNVMPQALDADMADLVAKHLESLGVKIHSGSRLTEVTGGDSVESVVIGDERIPANLLVAAAGVRPNSEIAAAAGIKIGGDGGIVVDRNMMTSAENIFATGDCVQTTSIIDGHEFTLRLSTTAYRQGTIAGANMAGGDMKYPGVTGAFVSKIGELEVAAVGYTTALAAKLGYTVINGKIRDRTLYDWYPGGSLVTVKVLVDNDTGKLLGAQAIGKSGAAERVNVVSTAITSNLTADRLSGVEMAYCPAVSQAYDPLMKAIDLALRKRK